MDRTGNANGSPKPITLGPLESEVMDLVWNLGEAKVRDVYRVLLKKREIAYTTVMTIMGNLASKGALNRHWQNRAYVYVPAVSRDDFARAKVIEIVDNILDVFTEPAMAYLVDRMAQVDPQRLAELEKAIARLRKQRKAPSGD